MGSLQDMSLPRFPLLPEKETLQLIKKAHQGDCQAREKLINCNYRLVFNIVKRFTGRGYDEDDLFQIGVIGLIKAIDNFDPSYGVKFSTYAIPMIIGEIRRFLRDDHPVKVARALREKAVDVKNTREKLMRKLDREPTVGELADALKMTKDEVLLALEAVQLPVSLFETIGNEGEESPRMIDCLQEKADEETRWLERIDLRDALVRLPERERQIILLRYFQDKTQTEVGSLLGLSQVQVSRLERRAVAKLREYLC
ncbi:sporulation sigma-G factor SigG [Thermacetogenium phaeum DSM 12270]|jgi:RNA polymerase sporulation-specific sigma factor|uniref:RNA polymerase sigma factor n=1 Tax=Thermacetogenium phaeum (strain ATCC BAA-254 / DSM 26808 / PB) TaxID=1089553 RepID=K4LIE8_THEPS|nr:SigF/SigG family RNA polymerase sporulation sigma factor [Thermacetogenium phaeum]AFV11807.1 sporulation sigma-G factor SigG [Thermacetogenium phaeum DSM 12270]